MNAKIIGFTVIAIIVLLVVFTARLVNTRKERDLYLQLRSLNHSEVERIIIENEGAIREIADATEIDDFGEAMASTERRQSQQMLPSEIYHVVIVLASGKRIEARFFMSMDEPYIVFIDIENSFVGRFKNRPLYGWMKNSNHAP